MTGPLATQAAAPADWLTRLSQAIGRHIPDAMSTAVGMLLLLAVGALAIGNSAAAVMDAFYRGLWMLLPFTMQMALILVLSSTLGEAPVFRQAISRLSRLPRTRAQVFALSCLAIACLAYLYWGLAMALGPLVAVYFAREAERKGIAVDFPFLLATTGSAQAIWQFGLSASAPLLMNTPGHFPREADRPDADAFALAEPLLVIAEAEPIDHDAPRPTLSGRVERSSLPVAILATRHTFPFFTALISTVVPASFPRAAVNGSFRAM